MRLFEQVASQDARVKLILRDGIEKAAAQIGTTVAHLQNEIAMLRYGSDSVLFAEKELKISDKDGKVRSLNYNRGQMKIALAKEKQIMAGKPVRICLLKARQFGGSTLEEGDVFRECTLRPSRSCMIIAHDLDSARHLREMSARFYDYYRLSKPKLKKETDKWWKFQHKENGKAVDSHLRIDTAEELSTGHSHTLHHLHLSELSLWRNAAELVKGLFPTVPNSSDTTVFMEGTGSGVGDYWYDFCQMAMNDTDTWEFVFVPWYEIEDYITQFPSEEEKVKFEASLDGEESILFKQKVSLEQLLWRRRTISKIYKGDIDAFRQQYPASAEEAFLSSGRSVFNPIKVKEGLQKATEPMRVGGLAYVDEKINFSDNENGFWELWEEPVSNVSNLYSLGADVAEGIAVVPELGNKGGDYSCAKIFRRDTRKMVARFHARVDPDLFAEEIVKIWKYFTSMGILIENNPGGSGNVVIRALKEIPGMNLLKTVTIDRVHDRRKEEYGWDTNAQSKRVMIDELTEGVRENSFTDLSRNFWYEASTYIRDEKGRTNAQGRKFDDEVMAAAVCFQADKMMSAVFRAVDIKKDESYRADADIPQNWDRWKSGGSEKRHNVSTVMEDNYV